MAQRPVLERWLHGAAPSHPLKRREKTEGFLDALEQILAPIDAAQPKRLPTKIKAFRTLTADSHLLEQRAELLVGSLLARQQVGFEFAQHYPDYVLGNEVLGIEVGTRAIDAPWKLHDLLEEMLAESERDLHVQLTFDSRPLKIGAARLTEIAEQIANSTPGHALATLRFDDVGLSATLHSEPIDLISRVTVGFGGGHGLPLASHMEEVERELKNKAAEKSRQAAKMPTLLLVDMSRVGWSWMRGTGPWIDALRRVLVTTPFVGLGVFFTSLEHTEPMYTHLALAESLDAQLTAILEQVAAAMGLTAVA